MINTDHAGKTNIIYWQDEWFDDGSGFTGWKVFTSSLDLPKGWTPYGWEESTSCNMGYSTTVWKTTDHNIVKRDANNYFDITQEAFDKLT